MLGTEPKPDRANDSFVPISKRQVVGTLACVQHQEHASRRMTRTLSVHLGWSCETESDCHLVGALLWCAVGKWLAATGDDGGMYEPNAIGSRVGNHLNTAICCAGQARLKNASGRRGICALSPKAGLDSPFDKRPCIAQSNSDDGCANRASRCRTGYILAVGSWWYCTTSFRGSQ